MTLRIIRPTDRLALLMHGCLTNRMGKMGHGLLRYSEAHIAAVIDREHAGGEARRLTGIPRDAPVVASVTEAVDRGANILLPAIAPTGGVLPPEWIDEIRLALEQGMSLVNGLHAPLADDPDLLGALRPERFIWDVRQEPPGLRNGSGAAREMRAKRILTVGTDMAIGKMTTTIELNRAAQRRELRSKFLATGQIGICIAGEGVALDAVRVDFASGAAEQLVTRSGDAFDLLWVEGQGSVLHPASTAWLSLMRGSMPTHLILCHRAGQQTIVHDSQTPIPPLPRVAALYEAIAAAGGALPAAPVVGIALNTAHLGEVEARSAIARTQAETGLPTTDTVRFGADLLLDAVLQR